VPSLPAADGDAPLPRHDAVLIAVGVLGAIVFLALTAAFWLGVSGGSASEPHAGWAREVGRLGSWYVLPFVTVLLALVLGLRGRWSEARFLLIAVGGAGILMYTARVLLEVWGADPDGGRLSDYPSGHTTATTALAGALAVIVGYRSPRLRTRAVAVACASGVIVLMCVARVLGGGHTVLDVVGGVTLGVAWLAVSVLVAPPDGARFPSRLQILWSVLLLGVGGFVLFAALYDQEPFSSVDADVARRVAQSMPGWAEALARPFSWTGGVVGVVGICVVAAIVLGRERSWLDFGFLLAAAVGSQLLVWALKAWFDRPRPDAGAAIPLPHSPSFPSGHATAGVAVVGAVAVLVSERVSGSRGQRWVWALAAVLALGIGLSRIVLNVHYVTDVLAGWCLGLSWLAACLLVRDRLARRQVSRATALRLPT
jgi:membrane-associated phospholipid phosphatase